MIEEIKENFIQKMKMLKQRIEVRENNPCYHDETETLKRFHERLGVYEELEQSFMYLIGEVERLKGIEEHAIKRIKAETQENHKLNWQVEELQKALEWIMQYEQPKGYEDWIMYQSLIRNTARQAIERSKSK